MTLILRSVSRNVSILRTLLISLTIPNVGEAISKNPGFLKLRRIRAAQNIAKTVRSLF